MYIKEIKYEDYNGESVTEKFYFNFTKMNAIYSRLFEAIYIICLILIDFFLRVIVKKFLISSHFAINFTSSLASNIDSLVTIISSDEPEYNLNSLT